MPRVIIIYLVLMSLPIILYRILNKKNQETEQKQIKAVVVWSILLSIILAFYMSFTDERYDAGSVYKPAQYQNGKYIDGQLMRAKDAGVNGRER